MTTAIEKLSTRFESIVDELAALCNALSIRYYDHSSHGIIMMPDTPPNYRLRIMFDLALASGMREVELAAVRAAWLHRDVDEEGEAKRRRREVEKVFG